MGLIVCVLLPHTTLPYRIFRVKKGVVDILSQLRRDEPVPPPISRFALHFSKNTALEYAQRFSMENWLTQPAGAIPTIASIRYWTSPVRYYPYADTYTFVTCTSPLVCRHRYVEARMQAPVRRHLYVITCTSPLARRHRYADAQTVYVCI